MVQVLCRASKTRFIPIGQHKHEDNMIGETWDKEVEVITIKEALTRIHLEGLIPNGNGAETLVAWTGYPKPFSCGHDGVRGFGPLQEGKENNSKGSGRAYQEKCRVNQHFCSGPVLFYWTCVASSRNYYLNMGACVVIDTPPDCKVDTVLKLCFTA
jgi:hypothetical protein